MKYDALQLDLRTAESSNSVVGQTFKKNFQETT